MWLGWVDTYLGVILLYTAFNLPYVIWMMRGYILDIPRALEEAALVDGLTPWQVLWQVVLPMCRAGLFATAIFTFVFAWNDFLFGNGIGDQLFGPKRKTTGMLRNADLVLAFRPGRKGFAGHRLTEFKNLGLFRHQRLGNYSFFSFCFHIL